ncbi:MAG: hypothetical protein HY680_08005 [Chloroflexi bacterium]|nr:hypothetical protein [Chloroflexota bacterium]
MSDTQVPSEGAEHLAMGMLCRACIPTFKAPAFRASYDLVAINPKTRTSATIQVKSRFQTDCDRGFVLRSPSADFFVFIFLNTGNWYRGKPNKGIKEPEYFVLPRSEDKKKVDFTRKMPKLFIRSDDPDMSEFKDARHLVAEFVGIKREAIIGAT